MTVKVILVLLTVVNHLINADTLDFESCGKVVPNLRHYIYGGKSTMIEQWPWQVRKRKVFSIMRSVLNGTNGADASIVIGTDRHTKYLLGFHPMLKIYFYALNIS